MLILKISCGTQSSLVYLLLTIHFSSIVFSPWIILTLYTQRNIFVFRDKIVCECVCVCVCACKNTMIQVERGSWGQGVWELLNNGSESVMNVSWQLCDMVSIALSFRPDPSLLFIYATSLEIAPQFSPLPIKDYSLLSIPLNSIL